MNDFLKREIQREIDIERKDRADRSKRYGKFYWFVRTAKEEISFCADVVRIIDGALVAYYIREEKEIVSYVWSAGNWHECWAASALDGFPVCIDSIYELQKRPRLTQ